MVQDQSGAGATRIQRARARLIRAGAFRATRRRRSSYMALAATTRPTALALAKHPRGRLNENQPTADTVGDDNFPGGYRNGRDGYRRTEDRQ